MVQGNSQHVGDVVLGQWFEGARRGHAGTLNVEVQGLERLFIRLRSRPDAPRPYPQLTLLYGCGASGKLVADAQYFPLGEATRNRAQASAST